MVSIRIRRGNLELYGNEEMNNGERKRDYSYQVLKNLHYNKRYLSENEILYLDNFKEKYSTIERKKGVKLLKELNLIEGTKRRYKITTQGEKKLKFYIKCEDKENFVGILKVK